MLQNFKTTLHHHLEILLLLLVSVLSLQHVVESVDAQILSNSHNSKPNDLPTITQSRRSRPGETSLNVVDWESKPLTPEHIPPRLLAAALFRDNIVTTLGRVLLLHLDEESRVSFQKIKNAIHTRHVPTYDLIPVLPIIHGRIPRQQLHSVLQALERTGTNYVSSYASLCREGLTDGRVNMELTQPIDLLSGVDNTTLNSLAMDHDRKTKVPKTLKDALQFLMDAVLSNAMHVNLHLIAVLMLNLPTFDMTNPEIPNTMRYTANYMMQNSKSNDPLLEYIGANEMRNAEHLVKAVLERIELSDLLTTVLRESSSLLLQNFNVRREPAFFHDDNLRKLFEIVVPDFYPRDVVDVANHLRHRLDDSVFAEISLMPYREELQSLFAVVKQMQASVSLPEFLKDSLSALLPFITEKQREKEPRCSLSSVLKYLNAFRTPCVPKKLKGAEETLRPLLMEDLPWSLAFRNVSSSGDPRELLVNVLIKLRSTETSQELAIAIDDFIYHAQSSGIIGHPNILYQLGILFQREDSHEVELDLYSLLKRVPNVFKDVRFSPLLIFLAKPNILDYIGHGFNKFAHSKPRDLFLDLVKRAMVKPAVRTNLQLMTALEVCERHLEEPTLVNRFTQEDLQEIIKLLPGIERDPRYLPLKLLFKKQNLFKHISPSFSLAGLKSPMESIALVLNTVSLKPIDPRLSESIKFALSNIEGPPLPTRSLNHEDFVYLVNQLFSHKKKLETAILKSAVYKKVGEWNIAVSGTPENVLARILSYPSAALAKNPKLSKIVEKAENFLEEDTWQEVDLLKKKTLNGMLEFLPETVDLRPVNLLLKKANLAMFVPHLKFSTLDAKKPREALMILLQKLISSPRIVPEKLLSKRLMLALHTVQGSTDAPSHGISSSLTEELLNPFDGKYKPLWKEFKKMKNSSIPLENSRESLQKLLLNLQEESSDKALKLAAKQALEEVTYDVELTLTPKIEENEIHDVLKLLPNKLELEPLRKLLTISWLHEILPQGFQSSDYPNREQLLRVILYMVQLRPEFANNPQLMKAVSLAEKSLGSWQINVEPLKNIVTAVKTTIYEPILNLVTAGNLNKMNLTFTIEPGRAPRQSLLMLLHKLILHPQTRDNSRILQFLNVVRQDVLTFGVDIDLLSVLDNAGVPYTPDLAPLRLFLYDKRIAEKFGPFVFASDDRKKQFDILMALLRESQDVSINVNLLKAVQNLTKIHVDFTKHSRITVSDLLGIINLIPEEVKKQYGDLWQVFTAGILRGLTKDDEIIRSSQPLKTLLMKIMNLPEVMRNYTMSSRFVAMFRKVDHVQPQIIDYQLKPLLRKLYHVRQSNIDYLHYLIQPKLLLAYLPKGLDMSGDNTEILSEILERILQQRVAESNEELRNQVLSMQRDLQLTTGEHRNAKRGLSRADIKQIVAAIPKGSSYELVIDLFKTGGILGMLPKTIDWKRFKTPERKLMEILTLVEGQVKNDNYLYQSVENLKMYLLERFKFITGENVENMRNLLNELSAEFDLVLLKLFFTRENLIKYLPNDFNLKEYNTPRECLIVILDILSENPKLQRRVELIRNIVKVKKALTDGKQKHKSPKKNSRKTTTLHKLSIDKLKFILALEVENPLLRNLLNPEKLVQLLPRSFSFARRSTFKTKSLHLLKYLMGIESSLKTELKELVSIVESFPDVPIITDEDLVPLKEAIPAKAIPNIHLVTKYLKASKLRKLLPGNFDVKKHAEIRTNLRELVTILSYSICGSKKRTKRAFANLLKELDKIESSDAPNLPNVDKKELKSLLGEIPIQKYKKLWLLKEVLTEDRVMKVLPLSFNLKMYETKKLRVLAILKKVQIRPESTEILESVKLAEKCIEDMPDGPKINDADIEKIFKSIMVESEDLDTLLRSCKVDKLAAYLPINFNVKEIVDRKNKANFILNSCKKIQSNDVSIKQVLANAEAVVKILPNADLSKEELDLILEDISCSNVTDLKPLQNFILNNNLLSFLPRNLNLETQQTVNQKLQVLLGALRNVTVFQDKPLFAALETAEEIMKKMQNSPSITKKDIVVLGKLPAMQGKKSRLFSKYFTLENMLKVIPTTFDIKEYSTDESKLTALLKYSENLVQVKTNKMVQRSFNFVKNNLMRKAEEETVKLLESLMESSDKYIPLKLHLMTQKQKFFEPIADIPHAFEYPKTEDRLRVVLKAMLKTPKVEQSKSISDSIDSMIRKLSNSFPTEYEIDEAIDQIENSKKYLNLESTLRCKNFRKHFKSFKLTAEHTPKRLLLQILETVGTLSNDSEILKVSKSLIGEVQRAVRDSEAEELFEKIPNYKSHLGKLEAVRFYFVLHGPEEILGEDYRMKIPTKLDRLRVLCEKLLALPNLKENNDLNISVQYLKQILMGEVAITEETRRSIDDINVKSLFAALPKTRNEVIIVGILKFFSDPNILKTVDLPKDPFEYKYKGPLLQAIIQHGLNLKSVMQDAQQQEALEFFKDKIIMTGPGAEPIELKNFASNSNMKVDLIGLMKAVDIQAVNVSIAVKVANFFDTKYDSLIQGLGFDQAPYKTRGTYLKAFLEHLVSSSSVSTDFKRDAEAIIPAVKLDGPGAEPVDVNEEVVPDVGILDDKDYVINHHGTVGSKPSGYLKNDLQTIFSNLQQERFSDPWNMTVSLEGGSINPPDGILKRNPLLVPGGIEYSKPMPAGHRSADVVNPFSPLFPHPPKVPHEVKNSISSDGIVTSEENSLKSEKKNIILKMISENMLEEDVNHANESSSKFAKQHQDLKTKNSMSITSRTSPDVEVKDEDPGQKSNPENVEYITEEQAGKLRKGKRELVEPLFVHPDELSEPLHEGNYVVPHKPPKHRKGVNLGSKKLFEKDFDPINPNNQTDDVSVEDFEKRIHVRKSVKKDLNATYPSFKHRDELSKAFDEGDYFVPHKSSIHRKSVKEGSRKLFKKDFGLINPNNQTDDISVEDFEKWIRDRKPLRRNLNPTYLLFEHPAELHKPMDEDDYFLPHKRSKHQGSVKFGSKKLFKKDFGPINPNNQTDDISVEDFEKWIHDRKPLRRNLNPTYLLFKHSYELPKPMDEDDYFLPYKRSKHQEGVKLGSKKLSEKDFDPMNPNNFKKRIHVRETVKKDLSATHPPFEYDSDDAKGNLAVDLDDRSVSPEQRFFNDETMIRVPAEDTIDKRIIYNMHETSHELTNGNITDSFVQPDSRIFDNDTKIENPASNTIDSKIVYHKNGTSDELINRTVIDNVVQSVDPELRIFNDDSGMKNPENDTLQSSVIFDNIGSPDKTENIANISAKLDLRILDDVLKHSNPAKDAIQSSGFLHNNEFSHKNAETIDSFSNPDLRILDETPDSYYNDGTSNEPTDTIRSDTVDMSVDPDLRISNDDTKIVDPSKKTMQSIVDLVNNETTHEISDGINPGTVDSLVSPDQRILNNDTKIDNPTKKPTKNIVNHDNNETTVGTPHKNNTITVKSSVSPDLRTFNEDTTIDDPTKERTDNSIIHHINEKTHEIVDVMKTDTTNSSVSPDLRMFNDNTKIDDPTNKTKQSFANRHNNGTVDIVNTITVTSSVSPDLRFLNDDTKNDDSTKKTIQRSGNHDNNETTHEKADRINTDTVDSPVSPEQRIFNEDSKIDDPTKNTMQRSVNPGNNKTTPGTIDSINTITIDSSVSPDLKKYNDDTKIDHSTKKTVQNSANLDNNET